MDKIQVMIATDDAIFQEGLLQFLKEEEDLECVAKATNGEDTARLAKELTPDVVIMDVDIPLLSSTSQVEHAIEVARQVKAAHPTVAVLMVSAYGYQQSMLASLQAGVAGYLLKKTSPRELINAIRSLCAGEAVFDMEAVTNLIDSVAGDSGMTTGSIEQLRPREAEVLRVAAKGMSNKEIAEELSISERTVQTHMVNIFRKLEVDSRTEAVLCALREGWTSLDEMKPPAEDEDTG